MSCRSEHEEEAFQHALDEEILCNETYCPWWQEHRYSPSSPTCEGGWCEEAWQQYKDNLRDKPECYHAICQYSADGCSKCEYSGDCHLHFLTQMFLRGEEKSNGI